MQANFTQLTTDANSQTTPLIVSKPLVVPVILSGGVGGRLWPLSREAYPKPFIKLADGESFLQKTFLRAKAICNAAEILTVTNREYYFHIQNEYRAFNSTKLAEAATISASATNAASPSATNAASASATNAASASATDTASASATSSNALAQSAENSHEVLQAALKTSFLLEPSGRNTGPSIALAALYLARHYHKDTLLLILPSDHLIGNQANFARAVDEALILAAKGYLVTFGIKPSFPETGYGYIEVDKKSPIENLATNATNATPSFLAKKFIEKPNAANALIYMNSGNHYWNSGMFCFSLATLLEEMAEHAAPMLQAVQHALDASEKTASRENHVAVDKDAFAKVAPISIDYAVMEKSQRLAVVSGDFAWQDVGSWEAMSKLSLPDAAGNQILGDQQGKNILHDSTNCYIHSSGRVISTIGIHDLVIVDMPDALLIADRTRTQEVKEIVQQLKSKNEQIVEQHKTVVRPWGDYTLLEEGPGFKVKLIHVKPGAALSLQTHTHRSEHWVVVSGTAKVTNGDEVFMLTENESTYISAGKLHRLENPTPGTDLKIIEVQCGSYLGEDDIVRYNDQYGRVS